MEAQTMLGLKPLPLPSLSFVAPLPLPLYPPRSLTMVFGCRRIQLRRNELRHGCADTLIPLKHQQQRRMLRDTATMRADIAVAAAAAANVGFTDDLPSTSSSDYPLVPRIRGICFYSVTATAAIFLFAVMVVVHPFVLLFDQHRRRAHNLVAKIWATLTIVPFYKFEFKGMENLPPRDVPVVYVSNHQSFLDIYTLLTLGRSFRFISKRSNFLFPVIGWAMFLMGVIPLRRMDIRSHLDCLKRCADLLRKGASVFFFPEGTRSKDGKLGAFKKGAFSVAAKTSVPVVPITLMGTGELMPAGKEGILHSGSVKVVIHKPIEGKDADTLCNQARRTIADTLLLHGHGVHFVKSRNVDDPKESELLLCKFN